MRSPAVPSLHPSWRPPPVIKRSVFIPRPTSRSFPFLLSGVTATGSTAAASAAAAASCSAAPQTALSSCGAPKQVRWRLRSSTQAAVLSEFAHWRQTPLSCWQEPAMAPRPSGTSAPKRYAGTISITQGHSDNFSIINVIFSKYECQNMP